MTRACEGQEFSVIKIMIPPFNLFIDLIAMIGNGVNSIIRLVNFQDSGSWAVRITSHMFILHPCELILLD